MPSIETALRAQALLKLIKVKPDRIILSPHGGILFLYSGEDSEADIEFYDNGAVLLSMYSGNKTSILDAVELPPLRISRELQVWLRRGC